MAETVEISKAKYAADIKALRAKLSKGGTTITGAADGTGAEIVYVKGGADTLEVLIRKFDLYVLGFRGKGAANWYVFTPDEAETSFLDKNLGESKTVGKDKNRPGPPKWFPAARIDIGSGGNYNTLGAFDKYKYYAGAEIIKAVGALCAFKGKGTEFDASAAVILIFAISEAMRFDSVCKAIDTAVGGGDGFSPDEFKDKVTNWEAAKVGDADVMIRRS